MLQGTNVAMVVVAAAVAYRPQRRYEGRGSVKSRNIVGMHGRRRHRQRHCLLNAIANWLQVLLRPSTPLLFVLLQSRLLRGPLKLSQMIFVARRELARGSVDGSQLLVVENT